MGGYNMSVYRIYVEKKNEFAVEALQLAQNIRMFLQINQLESLRIINRYDVEGIDKPLFESCKNTVFSEPQVDIIYDEIPQNSKFCFAMEYLPGQYDQRADSCAQCIQIVSQKQRPTVRTARIFLLDGSLTAEDLQSIKEYIINPIESREASLAPFETLVQMTEQPTSIATIEGFLAMNEGQLRQFLSDFGLAMDMDDLRFCQEYFRTEDRDPTLTEIRMIDTYWSDHCRHTTFSTIIDQTELHDEEIQASYLRYLEMRSLLRRQDKPITLMDMATIGAKYLVHTGQLQGLDISEEVNACSVRVPVEIDGKEQPWLLMFKNETHNHPTEIEPFGGAATCIGGAIRDPLSGRSYVYQAMRVTGAGNPLTDIEDTLPGKLPQRKLVTTAAAGYSSYGNQIGLATGLVDEIYHPGYIAKRMEVGAVIGAVPESHVKREQPVAEDLVVLLGGKTGRDGCGGATGSSKSHTLSSLEQSGAEVQKGNAPEERKIQRLFREEKVTRLIKRCNDFGAGGVSVAIGELADGLSIQLDAVPKKYEGLDGTELAISESQERMAIVLAPENLNTFLQYASEENLEATVVALVTSNNRLSMNWMGNTIVDISRDFLNSNGAPKHTKVEVCNMQNRQPYKPVATLATACTTAESNLTQAMQELVADLNVCSKKGLVERFDSTIGAATVLLPFGGLYQATPTQAMVAKLPVLDGVTTTCSAMAYGYNPFISVENPYHGAYLAVVESISKLIATGATYEKCYLSFQEYFEKLASSPLRWGKPFSALLGALDAQRDLGVGAIGGKDSMSGSFEALDVPPTLISFAVSLCNCETVISPEFKRVGSKVVLLTPSYGKTGLPEGESLLECFQTVERLIKTKKVLSAYTPTYGGIAEGLFKMGLGNKIGVALSDEFDIKELFRYKYGSFLLELAEDIELGVYVGTTTSSYIIQSTQESVDMESLQSLYEGKLESVYPTRSTSSLGGATQVPSFTYHSSSHKGPRKNHAKPIALIPVFPGTNCEYDTARALERAGAIPKVMVIKNLTQKDVAESIQAIAEQIAKSQIIVLPGGFSGGDEPDGSGKFITAFFRNPRVTEEVHAFLDERDGLMCGICNGFQALIKLGLVPYGKIMNMDEHSPTLTFNEIGRHQSRLIRTRVASNQSPWLMNAAVGDIHTIAISHGEGRFVAEEALVADLIANGQIATQYVDLSGAPTMDIQYNPNGSLYAIEGITSPDGRIFGKMGHSERYQNCVYKNVPGDKDQHLFENAVRYFAL
jgi:phosphoribosylformylglycinamidine synthase